MRIRTFSPDDRPAWLRMRLALWPDETPAGHEEGMIAWLARPDAAVFLAARADGSVCGFIEVGSRSVADGCDSSPVGYIEGWYVDADVRLSGVGRALVAAAEEWARAAGYSEMGSDALLDNVVSHDAHKRLGYTEVDRQVTFRKSLTESARQ